MFWYRASATKSGPPIPVFTIILSGLYYVNFLRVLYYYPRAASFHAITRILRHSPGPNHLSPYTGSVQSTPNETTASGSHAHVSSRFVRSLSARVY